MFSSCCLIFIVRKHFQQEPSLSAYETIFFIFSYERALQNWKTVVYRFSISYLVLELQSFEDAKIKAKSTDRKHPILVTSRILNKHSVDS